LKKVFIDTNLFIRYLVNDVPDQVAKVDKLLDLAEKGKVALVTGPPVFFEMAWTLKSFYNLSRVKIYECLSSILGITGLEITDIDILEDALELYKDSSADFSDAYITVLAEKVEAGAIATFNTKHFKDFAVEIYPFE
jgi:predicted nucleic-acid-binding protein